MAALLPHLPRTNLSPPPCPKPSLSLHPTIRPSLSPHPTIRPSLSLLRAAPKKQNMKNSARQEEEEDEIPKVVFDRMVKRIIIAVGLPMGGGIGLLSLMDKLKESGVWDVPVWVPFACTLLAFGSSAMGIAYGTLSTSWEEEREGSLLGWEEVALNWPKLWEEEEKKG